MRVLAYDYFIRRFFDFDAAEGEAIFAARLARFRARSSHRHYRFISLNYTLRKTKLRFLLQALEDGYLQQGLVSVGGLQRVARLLEVKAIAPLAHRAPELERYSGVLIGEVPRDAAGQATGMTTGNSEMVEHDQTWFTVITETEMDRRPIRITEKALKPLVNFHPLLMLGNPGSLARLRDLGFETFAGVYDEAYDQEPRAGRRFALVYDQFAALCRAEEGELARQEAALSERLIHNARWGLTGLGAELARRDRVFLDQVFAP